VTVLLVLVGVESLALLALGIYCLSLRVRAATRDGMTTALLAERRRRLVAEGLLRTGEWK
jgi:hypothetical protein